MPWGMLVEQPRLVPPLPGVVQAGLGDPACTDRAPRCEVLPGRRTTGIGGDTDTLQVVVVEVADGAALALGDDLVVEFIERPCLARGAVLEFLLPQPTAKVDRRHTTARPAQPLAVGVVIITSGLSQVGGLLQGRDHGSIRIFHTPL
jgi:hypothetical protein